MTGNDDNPLGIFLRDRRARLDPVTYGFSGSRRRTPGLRREEVAQRANVSATWYTWLEQGRGGSPSADVLERLARALALDPVEREHLFLLAQHRLPQVKYEAPQGVTPRLQSVLDAMTYSPAFVRTVRWDIVAWNHAATKVLGDYAAFPPEQRNSLRLVFGHPQVRERMTEWERDARAIVATFRAEVARVGATKEVEAFVAELCEQSADFAAMWRDHDVRRYGEGTKHMRHPLVGPIALDYSVFAVTEPPGLSMVVYSPATPEDALRVRQLVDGEGAAGKP
ncbi:helix-turn-helix transcriptional regulator [Dyella telluris]|uniref:Helix-turn-helix domain-containing protein n=1 Tax=Dyella telluris TaxID=2763498 RepID=A0A7G8Q8N1_9GAMM|nr:helix-turn-helix transcriptional regulator [Dyella telluris]QNK03139.1 helix-turn-helix domain-containing protein [Dyella telluris]